MTARRVTEEQWQREGTLAWRAAQRWIEVLLSRGDADGARAWLGMLDSITDEGALSEACSRTGAVFWEVWGAFRSTVFRNGKRVIVPAVRCALSWAEGRPCTLAPGHEGLCEIEDVPIDRQDENMRRYAEELGAVTAAIAMSRPS